MCKLIQLFFLGLTLNLNAQNFPKIKIDSLINFNKKDSIRLYDELTILQNRVLSNPKFWNDIDSANFKCRNRRIYHFKRKLSCEFPKLKKDRHSYSNKDIKNLLFLGQDEIGAKEDGIINLRLKLYASEVTPIGRKIVHGRTSNCNLFISSNKKTRLYGNKGDYAAHLLHEYMHVLGFKHKSNKAKRNKRRCRGLDIPWKIQELAKKYLK